MRAIFVFFFCACISAVYSATFFDSQPEIPGHEGQCYDRDETTFYKKNDVMKNEGNDCIEKICLGNLPEPGRVGIEIFTCGVVETGPGCTVVQDLSKPYPECCPKVVPVDREFCEEIRRKQN